MKKPKPQPPPPAAAPSAPVAAAGRVQDSEPVAGNIGIPALLFGVLAALLFWGDMHIQGHGGNLDAQVHYPFASTNELAGYSIREPRDPRLVLGEKTYGIVCASCHQPDGLGGVTQGCPPLAGSDWVLEKDPSRIAAIALKGLTGPVTVSGKQYGTGVMVGFDTLSDEEIAAVLSFIRNNWSNKAPLVEVSEVKKVRAAIKGHSGNLTVADLEKLFPLKP